MNRRKFIEQSAAFAGFSLIVKAPQSLSAQPDNFTSRTSIANRLDTLAPDSAKLGAVAEEPNMRKVELEADVLVAGGGLAGVCAALAAARHGSKVILAQDRSRLGGNASSEIKMHPLGSRFGFREGGIIEEFCLENAYRNEQNSWEIWDLMLYDKVIQEPNIKLILDSSLYRVEKKGDQIDAAWVRCDKTEHLYRIKSQIYIDCTGDSRLGLEAGAEFRLGRESSQEFGESLADYDPPGTTQGSSILFTARQHSRPMPFEPPSWARSLNSDDLFERDVSKSWNYGYWWIELGGVYDTIRDNERLRFELLAVVLGVWDYIKNSGRYPDSANWALDTVGMIPGKRESRRLLGDSFMIQQDIEGEWKNFKDAVAFGGWSLDDHPALGFDAKNRAPFVPTRYPEPYNIPLGSLYSKNVTNLMMAGRNISASHVAFTSTRVMKTCSVIGQAAGVAAHLCASERITPRQLRSDPARVANLQQLLLRDGALIMQARNRDPEDHALKAKVTASASIHETRPENVITGVTFDPKGSYNNRWVTPMDEGEQWIRIAWDDPIRLREIQLIHDTGLGRALTMSVHEDRLKNMVIGPQPETCANYRIIAERPDGSELELDRAYLNYQRLRRHQFEPVEATAIKIALERSHGGELAGLYEVRAYS